MYIQSYVLKVITIITKTKTRASIKVVLLGILQALYLYKMITSTSLLILFLWSTSALHERYVKPDNPSSLICPGQPCLTLDQFASNTTYFTAGSTFLFLSGNHTLQTTINLTDIYDLKFKRNAEQDSTIHGNGGKILCMGVINLTIDGLTLKTAYLEVLESNDIVISNSRFLGNGTQTEHNASTLSCSNSSITVINCYFEGNTGDYGGAISVEIGSHLDLINSTFIRNIANGGGAIYAESSSITVTGNDNETAAIFSGNSAKGGGAIYLNRTTAVFSGALILFQDNSAETFGGGIYSIKSLLTFRSSSTLFHGNIAHRLGGAIYIAYMKIQLLGKNITFTNNSANILGGAMYGLSTKIKFHGNITFSHNSAKRGGGMYFVDVSLKIQSGMKLNTSFNNASTYGGAIYYEDSLQYSQCVTNLKYKDILPNCFIQLNGTELTSDTSKAIHSYYNTAGKDGSFMYGGSLDRCQMKSKSENGVVKYSTDYTLIESKINLTQPSNKINVISSYPYTLCFCGTNNNICDKRKINETIYRGQKLTVPLFAVAQAGNHVLTTVAARTSENARLEPNQTYQKLSQHNCSNLVYNLYSTEDHGHLELHPDGPCSKTYISFSVTFLPCPPGFIQSNDKCICEQRLMKYTSTCRIDKDDTISIIQNSDSGFWMKALYYQNGTYQDLILCEICPVEYCKRENHNISLDNPDIQCAMNRKGVLCGECITNYSLMFGSSRCLICSNTYLALFLPFAAAGIALVVFLSILRLTVATGMINSVILYANIVQVNRHLFFPISTVNVLTVVIAWMNLDLGIETCFYNGMTTYQQTWLQFAFPIYIWILITLIIITSRYSVRVSKLIGHNPIAVLATLLLMSYTKILNIIINVYSFAKLDYPDNKTVTVWLKDGNVPYLQSWHLLLTVVTSLVLVFLFLPYTLLLLLGYKLYCFSGRKHMHWLNRLKPLLDSYYAPYKTHTRCWTGFLLLVRCALYIVFSFGEASKNLLAIIITSVIIVSVFALLPGRIYTSSYTNIIESLVHLNLIILSVITFAVGSGMNSRSLAGLVYSLVGMVFVIMMGIIVYHFHTLCISHTFGVRIQAKLSNICNHAKTSKKEDEPISENTLKEVSTTVIELREPLLET